MITFLAVSITFLRQSVQIFNKGLLYADEEFKISGQGRFKDVLQRCDIT